MQKLISSILCIAMGVTLIIGATPLKANAETTTTVNGTVMSGTTTSTLNLKTPQGDMIIKIDGNTDTRSCMVMVPGAEVSAAVYYDSSDAHMHASKVTGKIKASNANTAGAMPVTGQICDKEMVDGCFKLSTLTGEISILIDSATTYSCGVLIPKKYVTVMAVEHSAGIYRAVSIQDYDMATGTTSGNTVSNNTSNTETTQNSAPVSSAPAGVSTTAVTGTVATNTTGSMLYLTSKDGNYELKFDSNTDFSNGFMVIAGQPVTANIYYNSADSYMHVASITRKGELSQPGTPKGTTSAFTGTVEASSTDGVLLLKNSGGTMSIRLDNRSAINGSKPVLKGSNVTVSCEYNADEYWHAVSITVN